MGSMNNHICYKWHFLCPRRNVLIFHEGKEPTSHDGPDRANESEDLGFDSWVIPKTSNSLVNTPANWIDWKRKRIMSLNVGKYMSVRVTQL